MLVNTDNQISNISFQYDGKARQTHDGKVFEQYFNACLDVLNEVNEQQITADQLQIDFATGRTNNMLSVIMAQEQAATSLNFTVQVTNKLLEAYREIIRQQV